MSGDKFLPMLPPSHLQRLASEHAGMDTFDMAFSLYQCIKHDRFIRAKWILHNANKEERKKVVCTKVHGGAALFHACQLGFEHFVNWLIEDCGADLEERGLYRVSQDKSSHQVTPLWCAAVANHLNCVQALIVHGAEVNATSDTDSTPVRSACFMTNIDVVKYLTERGADLHKPNVNGGTCLINSVQSVGLCKFLLDHGVDVNIQDQSGNIALHYAVREGRTESVKLLVDHGSDVLIKNMFGDDAILLAACKGNEAILEYLMAKVDLDDKRKSEAWKLVGCSYVDEKHDITSGWKMWRKAVSIMEKSAMFEDMKREIGEVKPSSAYNNRVEVCSNIDLSAVASDPDATYMQSLVMRERILGPDHKDTTFRLMYRGAVYADAHMFQRCVDLWLHAYVIRHNKLGPLNYESFFTLQALCKLFWELHVEYIKERTVEKVQYDDIMTALEMTISEIELGQKLVDVRPINKELRGQFDETLKIVLHLIHLLAMMQRSESEDLQFKKTAHRLVCLKPITENGHTLLHLAVDYKNSKVDNNFYSGLPSKSLTELLLMCGMRGDINAVNVAKRTPFHVLFTSLRSTSDTEGESGEHQQLVDLMLASGAHVDVRDELHKTAYDAKKAIPTLKHFIAFDHQTLKCLTASVVKAHSIPYRHGEVPQTLIEFIDMH